VIRWNHSAALVLAVTVALGLAACSPSEPEPTQAPTSATESSEADMSFESIAALGDSMTLGVNACGSQGACPEVSWAVGTEGEVQSLAERAGEVTGAEVETTIAASDGASSASMPEQATEVLADAPDLVTMLVGANDACRPKLEEMTPTADFTANVTSALGILSSGLPDSVIYVASVPNLPQLYAVGIKDPTARAVWGGSKSCNSLLFQRDATAAEGDARRAAVGARVAEYNAALEAACTPLPNCVWDGGATNAVVFGINDLSRIDYFHAGVSGQKFLADVAWTALSSRI
jgi:lysophospholipase L1-like esterase